MRRSDVWSLGGLTMLVGMVTFGGCMHDPTEEIGTVEAALDMNADLVVQVVACMSTPTNASDFGLCVACCASAMGGSLASSCVEAVGCCGDADGDEVGGGLYATHCGGGGGGGGGGGPPECDSDSLSTHCKPGGGRSPPRVRDPGK